ncbi:MAG: hypothetical protein HUJ58_05835 [Erysipelotrichaceae bacterium]|nr:hypothetical protein [Erysipelotrichaceae bacterium]
MSEMVFLFFPLLSFGIFFLVFTVVISALVKSGKKTKGRTTARASRPAPVRQNVSTKAVHEDHTQPLPHNSNATYNRNNEQDIIKDPPLSQAERNVLYGK